MMSLRGKIFGVNDVLGGPPSFCFGTATNRRLEIIFCSGEIWGMGRNFHFQCTQCQYHAGISGGMDSGLNCDVQTILCRECRELFDVFTRIRRVVGRT